MKFPVVEYLHFTLLWRMLCFPCIGNRKNLYYIIQPCQWRFRLVHFGSSFDLVLERTKGALQRLEVVGRASGLGSTIAVFFPCGPHLCIVRAFGDLSVIKAWFVLVSCLTNFNGLFCSCFVINWGWYFIHAPPFWVRLWSSYPWSCDSCVVLDWDLTFLSLILSKRISFYHRKIKSGTSNTHVETWVCCSCWGQLAHSILSYQYILQGCPLFYSFYSLFILY